MRMARANLRELVDLRMAINASFLIALYAIHLLVNHLLFGTATDLPPQGLLVFLVFWLLGVLWLAYRRWQAVGITEGDLEEILADISPDVFLVIDPKRRISMCNPSITRLLGYTPQEVLGRTTDVLYFDRRTNEGKPHGIHDQLERVGFHVGRATGRTHEGRAIPLEIITGTIRGRRGAVLLIRDISKRVEIENAHQEKADLLSKLEENYARLRATEEARDSILHMIVHDMKNPLQIILGSMQLLKEEMAEPSGSEARSYVDETLVHAERLARMVNSLLDVSRLEAGQMPLNLSPCDMRIAARRAVASQQRMVEGKSIQVFIPAEPVSATCDPELLDRVLANLISNAIYHTPDRSRIEVRVQPGDTFVRIEVADDGPGIPAEFRSRLFKKFASLRRSATNTHWSTGLGLTFCKLVIEAHGGRIDVTSEPGHGSVFWFELPRQPGLPPAGTTATAA